MNPSAAELEIWLRRSRDYGYDVELRFTGPDEDADVRNVAAAALTDEAIAALKAIDERSEEYGHRLFASLLSNAELVAAFRSAATLAETKKAPLRIRLLVDPTAPDLHQLRWEAMRDPAGGALLFTGDRVAFSRYIGTPVYRSLGRRPKGELRALAVIASPSDLGEWSPGGRTLAEIRPDEEEGRIREALQGIVVDVLRAAPGGAAPVGLQAISTALEAARYDILYLVCHGSLDEREPTLWLEGEGGQAEPVPGDSFIQRVAELANRPLVVVLASCKSAGEGDEATSDDAGVLAALGTRLAEAGVPAVLAMQGNVTLGTVRRFMPVFFRELAENGQIDRAAALARGAARERGDAWVPVLFMRLKEGSLWSDGGFTTIEGGGGFGQWPELVRAIRGKTCTPILGPGLVEAVVGSRRELALRLADEWDIPLATRDRDELPQVAQYLAVHRRRAFLEREVLQKIGERMQARHPEALGPRPDHPDAPDLREPLSGVDNASLAERCAALFRAIGSARAGALDPEPHEALAELPFPLYLSTNFDPMMEDALAARKRTPAVEVCRWNGRIPSRPSRFAADPGYRPTLDAPLVYHLFGHIGVERSLVLTQDDYLDALIAATRHDLLPQLVRTALTDRALLFLGFQIDDWNFRVLFRFLMNLEGSDMLGDHPHVAVQIDPEEQRFRNPRAARKYLEEFFGYGAARVNIYWGSAEDFVRELLVQCRKAGA